MCVTGHALSLPLPLHVPLCQMEQGAGLPPLVALYCVPSNQQELHFPEFLSSVAESHLAPREVCMEGRSEVVAPSPWGQVQGARCCCSHACAANPLAPPEGGRRPAQHPRALLGPSSISVP